ncbi:MAG: orotidine-5'-phosphate decarboxylase [Planctomycetia bacterium]|nr:orotidine-5'-phosphate decarboxylase [Planctomycetia bacterium]
MSFSDRLASAVKKKKTPVLVGLDPRWAQLPTQFTDGKDKSNPDVVAAAFEDFCYAVLDVVAELVPAVKPQAAFFEQYGPSGMKALANVIAYAHKKGLLVLFDGKRNDIGSTASAYAAGLLGAGGQSPWGADALTVSPYLGDDSLTPFVETAQERGAGIFILVKTSNPGGAMLQDLLVTRSPSMGEEGSLEPLYRVVGRYVNDLSVQSRARGISAANPYGDVGAVVGATWPEQLTELRQVMKQTWFLVPGYGSQGGGARDVAGAFDENGLGALINNSRGILFAFRSDKYSNQYGESNWERAVEAATRDMVASLAAETSAGRLDF